MSVMAKTNYYGVVGDYSWALECHGMESMNGVIDGEGLAHVCSLESQGCKATKTNVSDPTAVHGVVAARDSCWLEWRIEEVGDYWRKGYMTSDSLDRKTEAVLGGKGSCVLNFGIEFAWKASEAQY